MALFVFGDDPPKSRSSGRENCPPEKVSILGGTKGKERGLKPEMKSEGTSSEGEGRAVELLRGFLSPEGIITEHRWHYQQE